jgi:hypothetical protein
MLPGDWLRHYPPDTLTWEQYSSCKRRLSEFAGEGLIQLTLENQSHVANQIYQVAGDLYDLAAASGEPTEIPIEIRTPEGKKTKDSFKSFTLIVPFIPYEPVSKLPNNLKYKLDIIATWPKTSVSLHILQMEESIGRFTQESMNTPRILWLIQLPTEGSEVQPITVIDFLKSGNRFEVLPQGPYFPEEYDTLNSLLRSTASSSVSALDQKDNSLY